MPSTLRNHLASQILIDIDGNPAKVDMLGPIAPSLFPIVALIEHSDLSGIPRGSPLILLFKHLFIDWLHLFITLLLDSA